MTETGSSDGTFDFCADCPSHNNCCVRARPLGRVVESPFLLQRETEKIKEVFGIEVKNFANITADADGSKHFSLKDKDDGCIFYKNGACTVYNFRPLDCKIFPFDIIEDVSGSFFWIVYTELCPVKFNFLKYFQSAKRLFEAANLSPQDIHHFASHAAGVMGKYRYRVIERLALPPP